MNNLTPAMKQYKKFKDLYPNHLIFYRMGDFYELFYNDAEIAAQTLNIALTKRSPKSDVQMAGVPYHAATAYLAKLLKHGYSIVIVEQVGAVNSKTIVERSVAKILTPGTVVEDIFLENKIDNTIATILCHHNNIYLARFSFGDNDFSLQLISNNSVKHYLDSLNLAEIVTNKTTVQYLQSCLIKSCYTEVDDWLFDYENNYKLLCKHFNVSNLQCFGLEDNHYQVIVAGVLLGYLQTTHRQDLKHIDKINVLNNQVFIDSVSKKNLEIFASNNSDNNQSLFCNIDYCVTSMGSRILLKNLHQPPQEQHIIQLRLDCVDHLQKYTGAIREILKNIPDLFRINSRIAVSVAKLKDLQLLRRASTALLGLTNILNSIDNELTRNMIEVINSNCVQVDQLLTNILLCDQDINESNYINYNINDQLDNLRLVLANNNQTVQELENNYKKTTNISNLKISYNYITGHYIEISNNVNINKIPSNFVKIQSLKNVTRYTSQELRSVADIILNAQQEIHHLQTMIYQNLLEQLTADYYHGLQDLSLNIAMLDMLTNFAVIADKYNYCKPVINYGNAIYLHKARHPVIEKMVDNFVANDITIDQDRKLLLITGPNMGGKSTYMRQTALIILMAYCGSFVPADKAVIGRVDRIFTRIGAGDDIVSGKSTFMVEMAETAHILNYATANSLVLIDEIGRGTSTYDGLVLARSILEHLANNIKSYCFFATHYFELVSIVKNNNNISILHLEAVEYEDRIIFLHHVKLGYANKSYGLAVAAQAGIAKSIINQAKKYLAILEQDNNSQQLELRLEDEFVGISPTVKQILDIIKSKPAEELTAREALNVLYQLQELC